jgi:tetratricopeptide (TPR) repeat protein
MKINFTFLALLISISLAAQRIQLRSTAEILKEADWTIHNYQFERALVLLNQIDDSLNTEVLQKKGYCYSRLGNYHEAIGAYQQIVKLDSTNTNAANQLGQLFSRTGQIDLALRFYQKLIDADSTNSFYYKQYASLVSQTGDIVTAMAYYLKTIELNPRDVEAYTELANLLLDADLFSTADSILTKAVTTMPHPQLQLLLAKAQFGEEKYQLVIDNVNGMLSRRDTTATMARLLGISYFQLHQYNEVVQCMNYLLAAGAQGEWIYYYLGASYDQLKKFDKAIMFVQKAIDMGISDNIDTYYTQLAVSYENTNDFKNAIHYYKAAYETSKSDILLYHLARNYDQMYKDKSSAIAFYKRYLNSDDTIKVTRQYSEKRVQELADF